MWRMTAFVEVYRALEYSDVICVRSYLDAQGFFTLLLNEHHITQSSAVLSLALGGYQILVPVTDAAEAKSLLSVATEGEFRIGEDFDESQLSL